jgi:hypothetical protein
VCVLVTMNYSRKQCFSLWYVTEDGKLFASGIRACLLEVVCFDSCVADTLHENVASVGLLSAIAVHSNKVCRHEYLRNRLLILQVEVIGSIPLNTLFTCFSDASE